jgi:type III restriction enzyme
LEIAAVLENRYQDVKSFAKNTMGEGGVNFKIEYQAADGNIRDFFPDFFAKTDDGHVYVIETKGREDLNDLRKIKRLKLWCDDVNKIQSKVIYKPVYVKQEDWDKRKNDIKSLEEFALLFIVKDIAALDAELIKDEAIAIINKGADVSNFGDPVEWQKEIRTDRKIE